MCILQHIKRDKNKVVECKKLIINYFIMITIYITNTMEWTIIEYNQWIKDEQPINLLVTKLEISNSNKLTSLKGMSCLSGMRPCKSGILFLYLHHLFIFI